MGKGSGDDHEVQGVRLSDLYEDADGSLWKVVGIATSPTVTVERVNGAAREHHVIESLNWRNRWKRRYRAEEMPGA